MTTSKSDSVSARHLLLPIAVIALTLAVLGGFQMSEVLREHAGLKQAFEQQKTPLEESAKVEAQFSALALGVKKLAEDGNKDAETLLARMKKAGVNFDSDTKAEQKPATATPAADAAP